MASAMRSVWAIDIGSNSLKALRMLPTADGVQVIGFDYIEHSKMLSGEEVSAEEKTAVMQETMSTFVARNDLKKDPAAISVPGQSSFARFIKLPPVEQKRIPEIIKFEAVQQIPFDINEVEWDWQIMEKSDSPDTEVGIFAIKNELINDFLENFSAEGIRVSVVQMGPMALYNYAHYDRNDMPQDDSKAIIILDMGTENTNLVVCTQNTVWQRTIPLGGNSFTRAVADAFKLNFAKAEKLKRTAPMSKYARQIFHSMRPVFTDFSAEIQRSLGFYSSSHRKTDFTKVIVMGGGFKMQGLIKFLQQTLQLPVIKPESFDKLKPAENVSAAQMHENICDMGIAYGLGLQALGLAKVQTNLLPRKIALSMTWKQKSLYLVIAAGLLVAAMLISMVKTGIEKKAYYSKDAQEYRRRVENILSQAEEAQNKFQQEQNRRSEYEQKINRYSDLFKYRQIIPQIHETIAMCLPNAENNPQQSNLYKAFAEGDVEAVKSIPRKERKQIFVTGIQINFASNVASAQFGQTATRESTRSTTGGGMAVPGMMGPGMMGPGMMGPGGFEGPMGAPGGYGGGSSRGGESARKIQTQGYSGSTDQSLEAPGQKSGPGFTVVIEGYSPYMDIDELLDPAGVGDNKSKWGFLTRLANLDKLIDGNSPFELYGRGMPAHWVLETGDVAIDVPMPEGIGVEDIKVADGETTPAATSPATGRGSTSTRGRGFEQISSEKILIDPMTKEEISRSVQLDQQGNPIYDVFKKPKYIVRDKWFRIKIKLLWRDAPQMPEQTQS